MQLQTAEDCFKCMQRQQERSGPQWSCTTSVGRSVPPTSLIAVDSDCRHHSHGEARPQGKMALDRGDSDRPAPPARTWYVQELVTNGAPVGAASHGRIFEQKTQDVRQYSELNASWSVNYSEGRSRAHCHSPTASKRATPLMSGNSVWVSVLIVVLNSKLCGCLQHCLESSGLSYILLWWLHCTFHRWQSDRHA